MINYQDPDIRRYSYEMINQTISIFIAVLFFLLRSASAFLLGTSIAIPVLEHRSAIRRSTDGAKYS